jgi:hypothetical protein
MVKVTKVDWGPCCFCGQEIAESGPDPCRVTVETSKDLWQVWFAHCACFKSRIASNAPVDLSPAHF